MKIYNYSHRGFKNWLGNRETMMFVGYSGKEYERDPFDCFVGDMMGSNPAFVIGAGASSSGVGRVYEICGRRESYGIISSKIVCDYSFLSNFVDHVWIVTDPNHWAGKDSETSAAILETTNLMVNIKGGPGSQFEFAEHQRLDHKCVYHPLPVIKDLSPRWKEE